MRSRQATLRTWMVTIAAFGLILGWVRSNRSVGYALVVVRNSFLAWGLCFLTAYTCGRRFGPTLLRARARTSISACIVVLIAAGVYLAWSHRRAIYFADGLEQQFPYPDQALVALDLWFESRYPTRPGSLKSHGEWPRVAFLLGITVLLLAVLSGLLVGVLSNRAEERKCPFPGATAVIVGVVRLTLLAPIFLLVTLLVRISSPGPILVDRPQCRDDGTIFSIAQFRTFDVDSTHSNRLGRFLQKYNFDLIPAHVSLLQGEMTLRDYWDLIWKPAFS